MSPFVEKIRQNGHLFHKRKIHTLQINMGWYCNQACLHCHVEASPGRKEIMGREVVDATVQFLKKSHIALVDIIRGAPEFNPNFGYLVESCAP